MLGEASAVNLFIGDSSLDSEVSNSIHWCDYKRS